MSSMERSEGRGLLWENGQNKETRTEKGMR